MAANGYGHFEPLKVEGIDTTAAGDAFAVTRWGASPSLPTKSDVDPKLRERAL
jgi:sugar/nucleoside kinase (ribokinase family)